MTKIGPQGSGPSRTVPTGSLAGTGRAGAVAAPAEPKRPTPGELAKTPPNPDAAVARREAERIWTAGPRDVADRRANTTVHRAANDVYGFNTDEATEIRALRQFFANRKLEQAALARLAPEDRGRYERMQAMLEETQQGQLALQLLLIEGKLTDGRTSVGGKTLMRELDAFALARLDENVLPKDALACMIREIAMPAAIKQKDRESCTVTTLQILTASERPAEYVRILAGLMAPPGTPGLAAPAVRLADGTSLGRITTADFIDDSGRTLTSQLWQDAFMGLAASGWGQGARYDVAKDETVIPGAGGKPDRRVTGQLAGGMDRAAEALTGKTWDELSPYDALREAAIRHLDADPPRPVAVTLRVPPFDDAGNPTRRERLTALRTEGQGEQLVVVCRDAKGRERRVPGARFIDTLDRCGEVSRDRLTEQAVSRIEAGLAAGRAGVPAALYWGELDRDTGLAGGHQVLVTAIARGRVTFVNPQGKVESMALSEFRNRLKALNSQA